ncbi:hypothetical protein [Hahella sp. NBU794]|uniref:hypothetical protein n=1 Tax=Hahella sp. NBU794 TaxID=3422590 RepID=UPI003D6EEE50
MNTRIEHIHKLGVDIGRVIISPVKDGKSDTAFLSGGIEQALLTPPAEGAIERLTHLVEVFEGRVWLVSKAGKNTQHKTRLWLAHHRFFERTGMPAHHLRFCFKRHEKAGHCAELGLTHFVDDRLDVLRHLQGLAPHLYLFGEQLKSQPAPDWVEPTLNWDETFTAICRSLD